MMLSLVVAGLGIGIAFLTYSAKKIDAEKVAQNLAPAHRFLVNKWYFDELYGWLAVGGTLGLTKVLRWFDETIIDGVVNGSGWLTKLTSTVSGWFDTWVIDGAVNAIAYLSGFGGLVLRKVQTGKVQTYVVLAVVGVMVLYFVMRAV
jgi:NADH-quinone oxidoreductase subunit L